VQYINKLADDKLLMIDLSTPFNWSNHVVKSIQKSLDFPNIVGGKLLGVSTGTQFALFSGWDYGYGNTGVYWIFNTQAAQWSLGPTNVSAIAYGAVTVNQDSNTAYFLGGGVDDFVVKGSPTFAVNELLTFNLSDMSWKNDTGPGRISMDGLVEYIPVGKEGALVAFGGVTYGPGTASSTGPWVRLSRQLGFADSIDR
jgi:hypothetical protein